MRRPAGGLLLLIALLAILPIGCDGDDAPTTATAPPPDESGYFVGRSGDDVGASVDFGGYDDVSLALLDALDPDRRADRLTLSVGIAAVVSNSTRTLPEPVFVGVLPDGSTVALRSARRALAGRDDPEARRARALLPVPGPLAPNGTRTVYLLLDEVRPGELAGLRMRVGVRDPADLRRQRR